MRKCIDIREVNHKIQNEINQYLTEVRNTLPQGNALRNLINSTYIGNDVIRDEVTNFLDKIDPFKGSAQKMLESESPLIRGIGYQLLENAEGATKVAADTAAIRKETMERSLRTAHGGDMCQDFNDYINEVVDNKALGVAQRFFGVKIMKDFNDEVISGLIGNLNNLVPSNMKASVSSAVDKYISRAKARAKLKEEVTGIKHDYQNELPFEFDSTIVTDLDNVNHAEVVGHFTDAILSKNSNLSRNIANDMSEILIDLIKHDKLNPDEILTNKNIQNLLVVRTQGLDDIQQSITNISDELNNLGINISNDLTSIVDDINIRVGKGESLDNAIDLAVKTNFLKKTGLSDSDLEKIDINTEFYNRVVSTNTLDFDNIIKTLNSNLISNTHTKELIDINKFVNSPINFFDISKVKQYLSSDIANIESRKIQSTVGNMSLHPFGYAQKGSLKRTLALERERLLIDGKSKKQIEQFDKEAKELLQCEKLIRGEAIDDVGIFKDTLTRLRRSASIFMLTRVGIASIPEFGRTLTQLFRFSIPGETEFYKSNINNVSDEIKDLIYITSNLGDDKAIRNINYIADTSDEYSKNIYSKFDMFLKGVEDINYTISLFRAVNGYQEAMVSRNVALGVKKFSTGEIDKNPFSDTDILDAGWGKNQNKWYDNNNNPITFVEYIKNKYGNNLDFKKLDYNDRQILQNGIFRITRRTVLSPVIGELPMWMNSTLGKTLAQFRTFQVLSFHKQAVHDWKHDRGFGAYSLLVTSGLAALTTYAQVQMKMVGMDKKKAKKYWEENMTGMGLLYNIINKLGPLSGPMAGVGALSSFGIIPDYQPGFKSPSTSLPVLGAFDIFRGSISGLSNVVTSGLRPDQEITQSDIKKIKKIMPILNAVGISEIIDYLIKNNFPEKRSKKKDD